MKRFGWITALCLLLLSGCSGAAKSDADLAAPAIAKEKDLRIAVATDTHYLASELTDGGAAFKKYVANGDGKALAESDAIVDAFLDGVRAEKADMLILSGDLTNNGERKSHEKLAKKLEQLEKTGTNVYVIPGNHDINNPWARSFRGEEQLKTDSITPDDFRSIYQSFGFNEAVSKDKFSLSYLAKASQDVWLLMLDTSHYNSNYQLGAPETEGGLTSGTLDWIKECSKLAQKNGARILPVMHHNLVTHSEVLSKAIRSIMRMMCAELLLKVGLIWRLAGIFTHRTSRRKNINPAKR
ncbi:hypothetical protein MFLO_01805 [Listeria floridensis FSL S10-1187]|uniref:Calcineurin-like phosphoesterase domain-containing protein n=1 Tax=Listeria floridensis FSL S10-1187 TaxID=1265817 RepID=A0ABN0RJ33_9LIST|nr:metallophosphoesterase [Listeria floridensis]EUJ33915.1 hypothetical protein MFLO_01805 [Listeria floridensis FSL S10-1187]